MNTIIKNNYSKAYVELYECLKHITSSELKKIPQEILEYIYSNRDQNYTFIYDTNKGLLEQSYMIETKSLIVKLYEKYLSPDEEKNFWKNYDRLCFNEIEEQKAKKYNVDNIFQRNNTPVPTFETEEKKLQLTICNESKLKRLWKKIMHFFNKKGE